MNPADLRERAAVLEDEAAFLDAARAARLGCDATLEWPRGSGQQRAVKHSMARPGKAWKEGEKIWDRGFAWVLDVRYPLRSFKCPSDFGGSPGSWLAFATICPQPYGATVDATRADAASMRKMADVVECLRAAQLGQTWTPPTPAAPAGTPGTSPSGAPPPQSGAAAAATVAAPRKPPVVPYSSADPDGTQPCYDDEQVCLHRCNLQDGACGQACVDAKLACIKEAHRVMGCSGACIESAVACQRQCGSLTCNGGCQAAYNTCCSACAAHPAPGDIPCP